MNSFFKRTDQSISKIIHFFKEKFINDKTEFFLNNKYKHIKNFLNKIIDDLIIKSPNLRKLIKDFLEFFLSNKNFILYTIKVYIYVCISMYAITWNVLMIALVTGNSKIMFVGKTLLWVYGLWTKPTAMCHKVNNNWIFDSNIFFRIANLPPFPLILFVFYFKGIASFLQKTFIIFCNNSLQLRNYFYKKF